MTDAEPNDLVAAWHDGAGQGQELHEFLGMTWEEYGIWTTGHSPQPLPTAENAQEER